MENQFSISKKKERKKRKKERKKRKKERKKGFLPFFTSFGLQLRTENGKALQQSTTRLSSALVSCNFVYYCLIVYRHEDFLFCAISMNASKFSWDIELLSLFLTNFSVEKLLSQAIWVIEKQKLYCQTNYIVDISEKVVLWEDEKHKWHSFRSRKQVLFCSSGSIKNGPPVSSSPSYKHLNTCPYKVTLQRGLLQSLPLECQARQLSIQGGQQLLYHQI